MKASIATLYYVHDPMCSWCWAFRPTSQEVFDNLPQNIQVKYLLGGLAPDTHIPMSQATQAMIQQHWHTIIERVPGTKFNFDFWSLNTPERSTYPACRAVLATIAQDPSKEDLMIHIIQQVYYLHAQNPSHDDTLIACAKNIGLNIQQFKKDLNSPQTQTLLQENIQQAKTLGVRGFPSLVFVYNNRVIPITIDYNNAAFILEQIEQTLTT